MSKHPFILNKNNKSHEGLISRQKSETRFKLYGIGAIFLSVAFLAFLLVTIFSNGVGAFEKAEIKLQIDLTEELAKKGLEPSTKNISKLNFRKIVTTSLTNSLAPNKEITRREKLQHNELVSRYASITAKNESLNIYRETGNYQNISIWVTASSAIDMLLKDKVDLEVPEERRKLTDYQISLVKKMKDSDSIRQVFNWSFLTNSDSRNPEVAGIFGSLTGSFFVIIICMLAAMPIGVGAAIYLEEFAPKNKFKDIIEIAINNLAAVPSIVYGLLGLAVFLNFGGLPRSSALAGGLTLALLVMPVIIVSTRNSIASIPPSIKDAAIGLGASRNQVVFHHVLPLALPGIMTGAILSMARALGETAPLLMIGMVAFVRDVPRDALDPSTALPVQIFIWSDLPELGFAEKTSGAIILLLLFLILANALAVYLRNKFEYKW